jgi:L-lysine 6-transaminase
MIPATDVPSVLEEHVLLSDLDLVVDLGRSKGSTLVEARTGVPYLDFATFAGSLPLGMNHPGMTEDAEFTRALTTAALHKITNPDFHSREYATFVATFARVLGDPALPRLFFVDGGALAVENAVKTAFDWKWRTSGTDPQRLLVMHLHGAFHGRSGYTLSLTNTAPVITDGYPQWDWPRLPTPGVHHPLDEFAEANAAADARALGAAEEFFTAHPDRVACFIAEPVQGAAGDIHLSARFLRGMRELCHEHRALLVLDEVQTGCGVTGTPWLYQQLGITPDLVAFGKKTQVCGVMAGGRVTGTPENTFAVAGRIGSTWGGNTVDMVRATRILEIIEQDGLIRHAAEAGALLLSLVEELAARHPAVVSNPRGRGLTCAFDVPDGAVRERVLGELRTVHHVLLLGGGATSVRFRPCLAVTEDDLRKGVAAVDAVLSGLAG